jgi:hypothetical protein
MDIIKSVSDMLNKADAEMKKTRQEREAEGYGTLSGLRNAIAKRKAQPKEEGADNAK